LKGKHNVEAHFRAVLADMDGTMFRGDELIPGAVDTYLELSRQGVRWLFLSNNATGTADGLAGKLNRLGVPVNGNQVINSASALFRAVRTGHRGTRVMVVGEDELREGLAESGAVMDDHPETAQMVVVALDRGFTYEKLSRANRCIRNGAPFWATNEDAGFPVPDGVLPGAGSLVAAVSVAAGRRPDRVLGKPEPDMALLALEALNLPANQCLVVGDRMETDILFAIKSGMGSALVLTGATGPCDVSGFHFSPDHVLDSVADIGKLFG
jgi:4-nitrophenyl phosphatase